MRVERSMVLALLVVVVNASLLAGCAMRSPVAADRAERAQAMVEPIEWPARWIDDLAGVADDLPNAYFFGLPEAVQYTFELNGESKRIPLTGWTSAEVVGIDVHDKGIIRQTIRPSQRGVRIARSETRTYELPLEVEEGDSTSGSDGLYLQFISWKERPDDEWLRSEASSDYFRKPTSHLSLTMPEGENVRGVAITLGPQSRERWNLRHRLPERGWAVLHMGMTSPNHLSGRPSFEFNHDTTLEEAALAIALTVDEQIAEYAYAAQAALAYAREHVPEVADVQVAVIGLSRGALIAPAVAALLGDNVDHIVLALGGANLLQVAKTTTFRNHGLLTMQWMNENGSARMLSRAERAALIDAYLEVVQLDPYRVAPQLHGQRVLMITAALDHIVPASTGRLLRERLGEPERWHYPVGHALTGWILNRNPDRIIDWLEGK